MRASLLVPILAFAISTPVHATGGYQPSEQDRAVAAVLTVDQVKSFMSKPDDFAKTIQAELVSAERVAGEYNANEVAADRRYFGKKTLLTGTVQSIKSGLRNAPYLVLRGNSLISPQASLVQGSAETAARLNRGDSVTLICVGDGSIIGTPQFKDCRFARDLALEIENSFMADIDNFYAGRPSSFSTAFSATEAVALAKALPQNSGCPSDYDRCLSQLKKIKADESQYVSLMRAALAKLKASGLVYPAPPESK